MALTITDADAYITLNCIDIEDFAEAVEAKKQRLVNVASRTLTTKYPRYTIPDGAVYEFANVLATVFNDTNRLAQAGLTGFTVDGVGSFDFKDGMVSAPGSDLSRYIPQAALDLIGAENGGIKLSKRRVYWTVL
ncbi:hypothetical protein [Paenibacillus sp. P22]|uniref:hypothetical protein n=1 Tax=Paenibacillus sp. P22 TaxID=483908 RepID=UPI00040A3D0E|nr:hypothetical protein [Paenibacillus sp. P22]CDN42087.1 Uncharacterized protein BN871_AT_00890 [Paenibacillus sp. P22]